MNKIKTAIFIIIAGVICVLSVSLIINIKQNKSLRTQLEYALTNNKAYELENSDLKDKAIKYNITIDELKHSKDSIIHKLNNARMQLKIKDRNIRELEYIAAHNTKKDSIIIRDTIFKQSNFTLDTLLKNEWASLNLHLKSPNIILAEYSFKNETVVAAVSKKETIRPSKKHWLCRLFQKKHTIIELEIIQQNPYCITDKHKYVKIIK